MRFSIDKENQLRTNNGLPSEAQGKKTNLYKLKDFTLFKTAVFFNPLKKKCKKQIHKEYPLAGPCICNQIGISICNKKQPFGLTCFFLLTSCFKLWLNGSQPNEDPIRAYQKREHLSEPYQKPWGRVQIFDIQLQSRPPLEKKGEPLLLSM